MGVINLSLDPGLGAEVAHLGAIGHGAEVGDQGWCGAAVARGRRYDHFVMTMYLLTEMLFSGRPMLRTRPS